MSASRLGAFTVSVAGSAHEVERERGPREVPDDLVRVGVRGDDREGLAVADSRRSVVGRLAAAARIEAGAVERQGVLVHRDHAGLGLENVPRLEVEPRGSERGPARRYAECPGAYLCPSASSHLQIVLHVGEVTIRVQPARRRSAAP